jgi:hypothetical protein
MNVKLEKRYSNGLNLLAIYTWSKFLDGGFDGLQHPDLRHLDKALSFSDVPHRLVGSTVYELPVGRTKKFTISNPILDNILGGWSVGLIAEVREGTPFGVNEQTNVSNTFSPAQRSNIIGDPYLPTDRDRSARIADYFNTTAFASPGVGAFGNSPRTFLRGPGMISLDTSVHKRWRFSERYNFQLRGDFFNLPNYTNFGNPNAARGNANFGRILAAESGRTIQISLRFEF